MATMLDSSACEQHRKIAVAVARAVTHAAAEDDEGVVQDLRLFEPGHEVAKLGG